MPYTADPASLRQHPLPSWFAEAKFGIFIHWSLSTVPAWAPTEKGDFHEVIRKEGFETYFRYNPYSEWYQNGLRLGEGPVREHHDAAWGPDYPYANFKDAFNESLAGWDPGAWAEAFKAAGARYVVLVTKHHDGFCLWPSSVPNPRAPGFHASRDVVGELTEAVRARGMRMGLYYSGALDWTWSLDPIRTAADILTNGDPSQEYAAYAEAQYRELIERYRPSLLWNDIAYPARGRWLALLADYYNAVPEGLVNDRWMQVGDALRQSMQRPLMRRLANLAARRIMLQSSPSDPGVPFDYSTMEYTVSGKAQRRTWECVRGIGNSFGYTANEPESNFLKPAAALRLLADVVSTNGNLLLNVGPKAGGEIQGVQLDCIRGMGEWLADRGEAIYGTRPWKRPFGRSASGMKLRFTARGEDLFVILDEAPSAGPFTILDLAPPAGSVVSLVARPEATRELLGSRRDGRNFVVDLPALTGGLPPVLRIAGGNGEGTGVAGNRVATAAEAGQAKAPAGLAALLRARTLGSFVVIAIIVPLLSFTGFNAATSASAPWAIAFSAMTVLVFGLLFLIDVPAQVRKELLRGALAPERRGGAPQWRGLWRLALPRATILASAMAAVVAAGLGLLSLLGLVPAPPVLTLVLVVATFLPVALGLRKTIPAIVAENEPFLADPGTRPPVGLLRYLVLEQWLTRLALMVPVNLALGAMIAAGQAAKSATISAAAAQRDFGLTFLIILICCFGAAGDIAEGEVWAGRLRLSERGKDRGRRRGLGASGIFVVLVALGYLAGAVYQIGLALGGVVALSPWTALFWKMIGVAIATLLATTLGTLWTLPRAARRVAERRAGNA